MAGEGNAGKKCYTVQEDDPEDQEEVPNFITEDLNNMISENNDSPLRKVAERFKFPLTDEDYKDLAKLGLRFEGTTGACGLSLPQLGINKRAIIFELKHSLPEVDETKPEKDVGQWLPTYDELQDEDPLAEVDLKKELQNNDPNVIWPKTLWINPTYTIPRDAVLDEDYEICTSLKHEDNFVAGPVFRLNRINYRAYDSQGKIYEGQAEGEAARVIQHEIDHLDGKLYIDYVPRERVIPVSTYDAMLEKGELPELQRGVVPQFN